MGLESHRYMSCKQDNLIPFTRRLANDAFAVCWFLITAVLQNHFVRRQKPKKLQTNNILQQKLCTFASKQKHKNNGERRKHVASHLQQVLP